MMRILSSSVIAIAFLLQSYALPVNLNDPPSLLPRTNHGIFEDTHCPGVDDMVRFIQYKNNNHPTVDKVIFWSYPGTAGYAQFHAMHPNVQGKSMYDLIHQMDVDDWAKVNCKGPGGTTLATTKVLWERASYALASIASGQAYILTGTGKDEPKADSVWLRIELPVIKAKGLVTSVVRMDPKDGTLKETLWNKATDSAHHALPPPPAK